MVRAELQLPAWTLKPEVLANLGKEERQTLRETLLRAPRGAAKVPLQERPATASKSRSRSNSSASMRSDKTWKDSNTQLLALKPTAKRALKQQTKQNTKTETEPDHQDEVVY